MSHLIDPDALQTCVYDKSHKVAASKLHNHYLRCKKNHPELDKILEICPFNVLHRFLPNEKEEHLKGCIDKHRILFNRPIIEPIKRPIAEVIIQRVPNNDEEDWDKEAEEKIFETKPTSHAKHSKATPLQRELLTNYSDDHRFLNDTEDDMIEHAREKRFKLTQIIASTANVDVPNKKGFPTHGSKVSNLHSLRSSSNYISPNNDLNSTSELSSIESSSERKKVAMGRGFALRKHNQTKQN